MILWIDTFLDQIKPAAKTRNNTLCYSITWTDALYGIFALKKKTPTTTEGSWNDIKKWNHINLK